MISKATKPDPIKSDEVWKSYNDVYEVSNHGNVRSVDRVVIKRDGYSYYLKGKTLIMMSDGHGYKQVSLGRVMRSVKVHRLVGELFIPNPDNKKTINHKDGVKSNNYVSNLEWATYTENNIHARATGLNNQHGLVNPPNGTDHWNKKLDETQVKTILICIKDGLSNRALGDYFKVAYSVISNLRTGKSWKHIQR